MTAPVLSSAKAACRSASRCSGVPAKKSEPRSRACWPTCVTNPSPRSASSPRTTRSGWAKEAEAITLMPAPGGTEGGLRRRVILPSLAAGNQSSRPGEPQFPARPFPLNRLRAAGSHHREWRAAAVEGNCCRGRGGAARAGRGGRSHAALKDANLDLRGADDPDELDVGLVGEIRMHADLRADGLP